MRVEEEEGWWCEEVVVWISSSEGRGRRVEGGGGLVMNRNELRPTSLCRSSWNRLGGRGGRADLLVLIKDLF